MIPGLKNWKPVFLLLGLAPVFPARAQEMIFDSPLTKPPATNAATNSPVPDNGSGQSMTEADAALQGQAFQLLEQGQLDAALEKANAAIMLSPRNTKAYDLRASIYAEKKQWSNAEKDYQTVLQIDSRNTSARFNLPELKFRQKQYDDARYDFIALQQDENLSDLAAYKVFLCDLFGGHESIAAKELETFDQVGSNPSYYYANAAWFLFHHQNDEAKSWLDSAIRIYTPLKNQMYAASLIDLGYLVTPPAPLPPPPVP